MAHHPADQRLPCDCCQGLVPLGSTEHEILHVLVFQNLRNIHKDIHRAHVSLVALPLADIAQLQRIVGCVSAQQAYELEGVVRVQLFRESF